MKIIALLMMAAFQCFATTPYMGLTLPTVSSTPGPQWATLLNNAFTSVDAHDHTSGKGIQVPTAGLNINADLNFGAYNITNLNSAQMVSQGSSLAITNGYSIVNGAPYFNNNASTPLPIVAVSGQATIGDIPYASSATTYARLAAGTAGTFLKSNGPGNAPSYVTSTTATPIASKTHANTGYTLTASDGTVLWTLTNSSNDTYIVPLAATVGAGQVYTIRLLASTASFNTLTGSRSGGDTFTLADGTSGATTLQHQTSGESYQIQSDGVSTWQVLSHRTATTIVAYTPTASGMGTVSSVKFFWSRNGKFLTVYGYLVTGTVAGSTASLTLPGSIQPDTTLMTTGASQIVGTFARLAQGAGPTSLASANNFNPVIMDTATASTVLFSQTSSLNLLVKENGNGIFSSGDALSVQFTVPISGWSS